MIQSYQGCSKAKMKAMLLLSQIFHAEQGQITSKRDLILSKKEARAVRKIKNKECQTLYQHWSNQIKIQEKINPVVHTDFSNIQYERANRVEDYINNQADDIRFKTSELRRMSPDLNQAIQRHEIASENEINIFSTDKVLAGYYEGTDSHDNSIKNSFVQQWKTPTINEAKLSQMSRIKSAHQTQPSRQAIKHQKVPQNYGTYRGAIISVDNIKNIHQQYELDNSQIFQNTIMAQSSQVKGFENQGLSTVSNGFRKNDHFHSFTPNQLEMNKNYSPFNKGIKKQIRNQRYQNIDSKTSKQPHLRKKLVSRFQALQQKNQQQESYTYTNADLRFIQEQIKLQVQNIKQGQNSVNIQHQITDVSQNSKNNNRIISEGNSPQSKRNKSTYQNQKQKREHEIKIECASDTFNRGSSFLSKSNMHDVSRDKLIRNKKIKQSWKDQQNNLTLPRSYFRQPQNQQLMILSPRQHYEKQQGQLIQQQTIQLTNFNGKLDFKERPNEANLYSQKGPILLQANYNKKEVMQKFLGTRHPKNIEKKPSLKQKKISKLMLEEKSQVSKFDVTSLGLSNNNQQQNHVDFISSFEANDQSDAHQLSILAISQANYAPSIKDSNNSARGRKKTANVKRNTSQKKQSPQGFSGNSNSNWKFQQNNTQNQQSCKQAVSSYSISSKQSGYSSISPLRDQKVKFLTNRPTKRSSGVKPVSNDQKRIVRKNSDKKGFDFENEYQNKDVKDFDLKSRPKRCLTLKQHVDKVIEEGSDDSFASDTPAQTHLRRRNDGQAIKDFNQIKPNFAVNSNQVQKRESTKKRIVQDQIQNDVDNQKESMQNELINNDQQNQLQINNKMKNDSSIYMSKNSLQVNKNGNKMNNSQDQMQTLNFSSNLANLSRDQPQVIQQQQDDIKSEIDQPQLRSSQSYENKHNKSANKIQQYNHINLQQKQSIPFGSKLATSQKQFIEKPTKLPNVKNVSLYDLKGKLVLNDRVSPIYQLPPPFTNYSQSYLPSQQNRKRIHQNSFQNNILQPSNTVSPSSQQQWNIKSPTNLDSNLLQKDFAIPSSHRVSLAKQNVAMLANKTHQFTSEADRANQNKFRDIARPYVMSNNPGSQKNRHLINGLIQQTVRYCPQNFLKTTKQYPTTFLSPLSKPLGKTNIIELPELGLRTRKSQERFQDFSRAFSPISKDRQFVHDIQINRKRATNAFTQIEQSSGINNGKFLVEFGPQNAFMKTPKMTEIMGANQSDRFIHPIQSNQRKEISKVNLNQSLGTIVTSSEANGSSPVKKKEVLSNSNSVNRQYRNKYLQQ